MKRIWCVLLFFCSCITAYGQNYTMVSLDLSREFREQQGQDIHISFSWPRSAIGYVGIGGSSAFIINRKDNKKNVDVEPIIHITAYALYDIRVGSGDTVFLHSEDRYREISQPSDYLGFNEIHEKSVRKFPLDDDGNVYILTKRDNDGWYCRQLDFRSRAMNCVLIIKIYTGDGYSVNELTDLFLESVKIMDLSYYYQGLF